MYVRTVSYYPNIDGLGRRRLLKQLAMLDTVADHLLIDMGAGISSSVMSFAAAADRVVVVTTPEPTSMTDAYGAMKALVSRGREMRLDLVVNMAHSDAEGLERQDGGGQGNNLNTPPAKFLTQNEA